MKNLELCMNSLNNRRLRKGIISVSIAEGLSQGKVGRFVLCNIQGPKAINFTERDPNLK